jgi:hypothetical protein
LLGGTLVLVRLMAALSAEPIKVERVQDVLDRDATVALITDPGGHVVKRFVAKAFTP